MTDLRSILRDAGLTPRALALGSGIAEAHIHCILSRTRRPSPETAIRIEEATGGAIARGLLRPDLWPAHGVPSFPEAS